MKKIKYKTFFSRLLFKLFVGYGSVKVGIYLRVSTQKQDYDSQLQAVTDYCKHKGYHDLEYFSEKASGAKTRRPVLTNLLEKAQKGAIKKVAVYKLDRLGRSLPDLINTINQLTTCGCDFVSVSDNIDTSQDSPFARLQLGLLASISEFEKSLIRDRVVSGLRAARAKGRIGGRPGLEQTVKDKINHMLKEGFHPKAIARECGVSVASVYKAKKTFLPLAA
jgi:DNA invertase Pin-like site-specific DNA recombinase